AQVTWSRNGSLQARRRVDRSRKVLPEFLQRIRVRLRRDVRQVCFAEGLTDERARLQRNQLCWPRFFAGDRRCRDGNFLHGKQRLSGFPIENEGKAHLRQLDNGLSRRRAVAKRHENRRGWIVVIPDIVTDGLVVPLALTGQSVQSKNTVRKQVRALPEAA